MYVHSLRATNDSDVVFVLFGQIIVCPNIVTTPSQDVRRHVFNTLRTNCLVYPISKPTTFACVELSFRIYDVFASKVLEIERRAIMCSSDRFPSISRVKGGGAITTLLSVKIAARKKANTQNVQRYNVPSNYRTTSSCITYRIKPTIIAHTLL